LGSSAGNPAIEAASQRPERHAEHRHGDDLDDRATPTTKLEAPMAFNMPICATFCRRQDLEEAADHQDAIIRAKYFCVLSVLCWAL